MNDIITTCNWCRITLRRASKYLSFRFICTLLYILKNSDICIYIYMGRMCSSWYDEAYTQIYRHTVIYYRIHYHKINSAALYCILYLFHLFVLTWFIYRESHPTASCILWTYHIVMSFYQAYRFFPCGYLVCYRIPSQSNREKQAAKNRRA